MSIEFSLSPAGAATGNLGHRVTDRQGLSRMARFFVDDRAMVSRPKLLLAVTLLDGVAVLLSLIVATGLATGDFEIGYVQFAQAAAVAVLVVAALRSRWSYSVASLSGLQRQFKLVVAALATVLTAVAGLSFLTGWSPWPPDVLVAWTVVAATARVIATLTRAGRLLRRTVIVGGGREAEKLIQAIGPDAAGNLQILGVFDDRQGARAGEGLAGLAHLGTFEDLARFCQMEGVDLLIVTVPQRAEDRLLQILQKLFALQVDVRISALNARLRLNANAYKYIGKVPMLAVMDKPLTDWDRVLKNVEDRVLAALLLTFTAPVMALVGLAIRLDSRGPVLFRQQRYGLNNELIEVFKFRSMYVDRSDATASQLVVRGDTRVTRVGRFIRRTSLDELPQLFNVLLGQMSLVGPRPHATQAKAGENLYQDVVQSYFARHRVKPGITGWAQVNGWRGETDTREKIEQRTSHDLHYIDNWSVLFDLYIIALTPISLISGKNAY